MTARTNAPAEGKAGLNLSGLGNGRRIVRWGVHG